MKFLIEAFVHELQRILIERMITTMFDDLTRRDIEMMILGFIAAVLVMQIFSS